MTHESVINAGQLLASNIKKAFYQDEPWSPKLAIAIGHRITSVKEKTRPGFEHFTEVEFLTRLGTFTIQDLQDLF